MYQVSAKATSATAARGFSIAKHRKQLTHSKQLTVKLHNSTKTIT